MINALLVFFAVVFLDVILSGDNAVVVAMAANTLPKTERNTAIIFGMATACVVRIILCLFTIALLHHRVLGVIGGMALLVVDGHLFKTLQDKKYGVNEEEKSLKSGKTFWSTIGIIALADIAMSLDNILAVAGTARNNPFIMSIGLICSIGFVALGAKIVSSLLTKWKFLNWVAIGLIFLVSIELMFGINNL